MKSKHALVFILSFFMLITIYSSAQPQLTWEKHFNGGSNLSDKIAAIALDNNCNVYITGQSDSIGQGSNIVTIKYDLSGSVLWKKWWDGIDHLDDIPSAIKVDNSGNVYVCGKSVGNTTGADWITIKYDSNGDTLWTRRYNNTQTNGNMDDAPYDMALASNGNVFVTGYSTNKQCQACGKDFYTIRYDANGNALNTTFAGSGNSDQIGKRIFVNANNVFMLGDEPYYLKVVKMPYDFSNYSTGNIADFSTPASDAKSIFVDGSGCYIAGTLSGNIVLKKFDPNFSTTLFSKTFSKGFNTVNGTAAIAVDGSSKVYIAGFTVNSSGNKDMWIIKCDSNGDTVWTRPFGNPIDDDEPVAIALTGSSPDILVCGYTTNASGSKDIVIVKYDSNGDTLWTKIFDVNGTNDIPAGFAKDAYNNLFVGGFNGANGNEDFTTLKYCNGSIDTSVTSINGDYLNCNQAGATYQWYKDGVPLIVETGQGINLLLYGNGYYFCAIDLYCCNATTSDRNMTTVGIENISSPTFSIYPNPSNGKFTLNGNDLTVECVTIKIYNILGEVVYSEIVSSTGQQKNNFDLTLLEGIYSIQVSNQRMLKGYNSKILIKN